MTTQEAIEILKIDSLSDTEKEADKFCRAYNMAIRSLESWEKVKEEAKAFKEKEHTYDYGGFDRAFDGIMDIIDKHLKEVEK